MNISEIGFRIESLIKEYGITNYVLSKETGVSQSTISRLTKGKQKPSTKTIKLISNYFEIQEKWILTGTGEKNKENGNSHSMGVEDVIAEKVVNRLVPILKQYNRMQKKEMEGVKELVQSLAKNQKE